MVFVAFHWWGGVCPLGVSGKPSNRWYRHPLLRMLIPFIITALDRLVLGLVELGVEGFPRNGGWWWCSGAMHLFMLTNYIFEAFFFVPFLIGMVFLFVPFCFFDLYNCLFFFVFLKWHFWWLSILYFFCTELVEYLVN